MILARHADSNTTRRFPLAVREDLLQRARNAGAKALRDGFVADLLQRPLQPPEEPATQTVSTCPELTYGMSPARVELTTFGSGGLKALCKTLF